MKPKGVTTQMKALNMYFLIVVFMLLLNRVHVLQFSCLIWAEKHGIERVNKSHGYMYVCLTAHWKYLILVKTCLSIEKIQLFENKKFDTRLYSRSLHITALDWCYYSHTCFLIITVSAQLDKLGAVWSNNL